MSGRGYILVGVVKNLHEDIILPTSNSAPPPSSKIVSTPMLIIFTKSSHATKYESVCNITLNHILTTSHTETLIHMLENNYDLFSIYMKTYYYNINPWLRTSGVLQMKLYIC